MSKKRQTLRSIATVAGLDLEETLLRLWESGYGYLTSFDTPIKTKDLKKIHTLLSVPFGKEVSKKTYWQQLLKLNDAEFQSLLINLGFDWNPRTKRLPKGAVSRLQKEKASILSSNKKRESSEKKPKKINPPPPPKVEWRAIGHAPPQGDIRFLTVDEVISFHVLLVSDFAKHHDPIAPAGMRSKSLLASAVYRPHTSLGSALKYPTIELASAALIHSIIHNHPFHNGNKRTALVSMLVMLDENGLMFEEQEDELFRQVMKIAKHAITNPHPKDRDDREVLEIAQWIQRCSRFIQKGERPIPFRKLRSKLSDLGCVVGERRGNKILVSRRIEGSGYFKRSKTFSFTLHCWTDGDEIDQSTISRLRRELELDEDHSVDSTTFYDSAEITVEGFIQTYRKTLQRLSKM